jgi:hypothetical protein
MELKYAHGWAVGSEHRNEILKRAYEHLRTAEAANTDYDCSTGDCFVYGFKRTDEDGNVHIEVMDCTVRREAMVIVPKGGDIPEKLIINNG